MLHVQNYRKLLHQQASLVPHGNGVGDLNLQYAKQCICKGVKALTNDRLHPERSIAVPLVASPYMPCEAEYTIDSESEVDNFYHDLWKAAVNSRRHQPSPREACAAETGTLRHTHMSKTVYSWMASAR